MSDKSSKVSMTKAEPAPAKTALARPTTVALAAGALVLCGLAAVGASASLFHLHHWLIVSTTDTERNSHKKPLTAKQFQDIHDSVRGVPKSQLLASVVLLVAVSLVAYFVWRGRHWSRMAVILLWVLCTATGALGGLFYLSTIGASAPNAFKIPVFGSAVLFLVAIGLVLLRPSGQYVLAHRPAPIPGAPVRRGLFAPRVPPAQLQRSATPARPARPGARAPGPPSGNATTTTPSRPNRPTTPTTPRRGARAPSKNRTSPADTAAEPAHGRAKAGKSRGPKG